MSLTPAQMAAEMGINEATTVILTNAASTFKGKQNDGQEHVRTHQYMKNLLKVMGLLSPKDGKPVVRFRRSPVRMEKRLTPEKCRGRELGILLEMQDENDVKKVSLKAYGDFS